MHTNFWKYFAAISVFSCFFVIVAGIVWSYSSFHRLSFLSTETKERMEKKKEEAIESSIKDEGPVKDEKKQLTVFAAGDIMLDRTVLLLAKKYNDYGFAFGLISSTLRSADLRVANLEGPITTNPSIANIENGGRGTNFTFSPKTIPSIHENFDIVSLANNHTTNFGFDGLKKTREFLDQGSVLYFGDPMNQVENISTIVDRNGIKIGFVGYHQLVETGFDTVIAEVKKIRPEVDLIIAYPHWGIEYVTNTPSFMQEKDGHALIDSGVDIVIGAHPHVIEPIEMYNNKLIFYSLGNFIFDQYFSLVTMQGLTLRIALEKDMTTIKADIQLVPVHISKESQPFVAGEEERMQILSSISEVSIGDIHLKENIKSGNIHVSIPLTGMKQ